MHMNHVWDEAMCSPHLTEEIIQNKLLTNSITGLNYNWMYVSTYGGNYDIVCKESFLNSTPKEGEIVYGIFDLFGKVSII